MQNGRVNYTTSMMAATLSVLSPIASMQKMLLGAKVIILSASKRTVSTIADATLRSKI
jgi:hypothetical protein